jgi:predicted RNA-binding protein with RPS1 domain
MVNSRMDNYLKDIDECLEMNEKINRKLDSNSNHSNSISNNEEEKNSI